MSAPMIARARDRSYSDRSTKLIFTRAASAARRAQHGAQAAARGEPGAGGQQRASVRAMVPQGAEKERGGGGGKRGLTLRKVHPAPWKERRVRRVGNPAMILPDVTGISVARIKVMWMNLVAMTASQEWMLP